VAGVDALTPPAFTYVPHGLAGENHEWHAEDPLELTGPVLRFWSSTSGAGP